MKIALIILGVLAVLVAIALFFGMRGMGDIKQLVIREVDLSKLSDGVYNGSYHKARWTYDVEVTIRDHRITSIKNTNASMAAQADFNNKIEATMLERQGIGVDVVSGATINTKAFQKAVEAALSSAPTPRPTSEQ